MKDETIIIVAGLGSIVILEGIALLQGINGSYLALAFTTIGGFVGFAIKGKIDKLKKE